MIKLILHYLLALPDNVARNGQSRPSVSAARRRKSMDLATMMASKSDLSITPILFNLVDLILSCLRSRNQQTIHVTLQLVSAILKRHHRYAIITLLKTEVLPSRTVNRTVGAHEQEIEYLMDLASAIGGYGNFDETYGNVLRDTMTRLESHPCSLQLVAPKTSVNNKMSSIPDSLPGAPRDVREHTLRTDDPLLNSILDLLDSFFVNPVETNLSVTETIVDLAICGYMSIEGWLARSPAAYKYGDEEEEADLTSTASEADHPATQEAENNEADTEEKRLLKTMERCRQRPVWSSESLPRILNMVRRLSDQVDSYKDTIPRFNELLQQRREAFQTADSLLDNPPPMRKGSPLQSTPERPSLDEVIRAGSPSKPSAFEGFAQRLLSELGTPSRSSSPRGKSEHSHASGSTTPGGHGSGNELAVPKAIHPLPKEIPGHYPEVPRPGIARSASGGSVAGHGERSHDEREGISASQTAEFAAIDQSILAKRIGLPDKTLRPIPLDLAYRPPPPPDSNTSEDEEDDEEMEDGHDVIAPDASESGSVLDDGANTNASVSHILTNVIIFQSFLMEMAALMQVRAGLFDEVRYV
jgi:hypothetical protein